MDTQQTPQPKNLAALPIDKKGRMIIRNLQFDLGEDHLRRLFAPFGPIKDVKVPLNPATNQNKGFGFVEFEHKNTAAKAIKALNNSLFKGRKIFIDFSVSQDAYRKIQYNNRHNQQDQQDNEEIEQGAQPQQDQQQVEQHNNELEEYTQEPQPQNKPINKNDLDGTLFVRNISYEMKEEEFFKFYQKFGALRYAKIVKQKDTGLSNGTGFIKYKDPKVAETLLEGAEDTSNLLYDLEVNGRTMTLQRALDRDTVAQKHNEQQDDNQLDSKTPNIHKISSLERLVMTDRNGKRNLKLALLGTLQIPQDTLEQKDKDKRSAHYQEKLEKLKNPNKFISPTRILIKGLPKRNFDESDIKAFLKEFQQLNYSAKDIKHKKFIKQIQLVKERTEDKSKGIAFVEFIMAEDALKFMSHLIVDQHYKTLNSNSIPIVEFAIQDIRVINKKLAIFEKQNTHQLQQNQKKKDQAVHKQKTQGTPDASTQDHPAKLLIQELIDNETLPQNLQKVSTLLKNMKSRGIRQRLKKRIVNKYGDNILDQQSIQHSTKKVDKVKQVLDQYQNLKGVDNKKEKKIKKKASIKAERTAPKVETKDQVDIEEEKEIKVQLKSICLENKEINKKLKEKQKEGRGLGLVRLTGVVTRDQTKEETEVEPECMTNYMSIILITSYMSIIPIIQSFLEVIYE